MLNFYNKLEDCDNYRPFLIELVIHLVYFIITQCNFVFIEQHKLYFFFYICQKSSSCTFRLSKNPSTMYMYVVLEGFLV